MRARWLLIAGLLVGFEWPGRVQRLLEELEHAHTLTERRDLLRLLATEGAPDPAARAAIAQATQDSEPSLRAEALHALALTGDAQLVERATVALTDRDALVREAAADALGRVRAESAVSALARGLSDSEANVRIASARALGLIGRTDVVPALSAALDDPSTEVRVAAARALGSLRDARALLPLASKARDPAPELRRAILESLTDLGDDRAAPTVLSALDDTNDQVLLAALAAVGRFGQESWVPAVEKLAASPKPRIKQSAEAALERLARRTQSEAAPNTPTSATPAWLPPLEHTASVTDEAAPDLLLELEATIPEGEALVADPLVEWLKRAPAALAPRIIALLGRSRSPSASEALIGELSASSKAVRLASAQALGQIGDARATAALLPWLTQHDPEQRDAAGDALAMLAPPEAIPALRAQLDDELPTARAAARALEGVLARHQSARAKADEGLTDGLAKAAHGNDAALAASAIRCLGWLHDDAALRTLEGLAHDDDALRRLAVLRAASLGRSERARALRDAADDARSASVHATALAAHAIAGDAMDAQALASLARGAAWPLGPVAAFALARGSLAGKVGPELVCSLLRSREPVTRANAIAALAHLPTERCLDAQGVAWLSHARDPAIRVAAARWARARSQASHDERMSQALSRCAREDHDARVRRVCANEPLPHPAAARSSRPQVWWLADDTFLISLPDGSGDPSWPALDNIGVDDPWRAPYVSE